MNLNQENYILNELFSQQNYFTTNHHFCNDINAILNQIAEPENSNDKSLANSTPQACFFIRSTRTPKERLELQESPKRLSMVACNGKGFALCCVPVIAVSQPVTRYRPKPENFQAVTLKSNFTGVTQMLFTFLCVDRTQPHYTEVKIKVSAPNENEARWLLPARYRLALPHPIAKISSKMTACKRGFMRNTNQTPNAYVLDEQAQENLKQAQNILWQAYTITQLAANSDEDKCDVTDVLTALRGVVNLMDQGLELLAEV